MGIVESCTSREKEDQANAIKIGLDDFQNKGLDFTYGTTFFQIFYLLAKKKELSAELRMNKLTPYIKEYDYLFADKIPRTHENLKAIKKENDLFQYSKIVQLVPVITPVTLIESCQYSEPTREGRAQNNRSCDKFLQLHFDQKIPCGQ